MFVIDDMNEIEDFLLFQAWFFYSDIILNWRNECISRILYKWRWLYWSGIWPSTKDFFMLPTLPSLRDKRKLREVDFCHAFVGKFFQTAFNLWQCELLCILYFSNVLKRISHVMRYVYFKMSSLITFECFPSVAF